MRIKPLTLQEVEYMAHALAVQLMNSENEPIPPFNTRYPGKLESSLAEPFQTFGGKPLHRTFEQRAAVLFYLITKNHCFENGNKRMAVTATMVFFFRNRRWLNISPEELYDIAHDVAESDPRQRKQIQVALIAAFRKYGLKLPAHS